MKKINQKEFVSQTDKYLVPEGMRKSRKPTKLLEKSVVENLVNHPKLAYLRSSVNRNNTFHN